ncbi:MAG: amidohydrolase [Bacteroidales bacterium]|nr:amidohydrolase [Bacteroidales bacterium]
MSVLIKNVLLENSKTDVLIEGKKFSRIGNIDSLSVKADRIIDGTDLALLPAFYNLHTHAAMCLLRGFCEDLPLMPWLETIWKKEAVMTGEDIYDGTRLAVLEMIRSGTVFFADMYWFHQDVLRAVEEMGIRCNIGVTFMDNLGEKTIQDNFSFLDQYSKYGNDLITFAPAPHAIYTCSGDLYKRCFENAEKNNLFMQTHLAETVTETEDCKKAHQGMTPVEYLDSLGVLSDRVIAAHCVHLTPNDAKILSQRQVTAVHNPCSNMKLSSGVFNMPLAKANGMKIALGTDGCSSNNNLSMMEEMKTAALLAKVRFDSTEVLSAKEVYDMATVNGAAAYGLNAGRIAEGADADCILVDMTNERLTPSWNLIYNMVYSADSSCIDTVISAGKILMEHRHVNNEEEIIAKARKFIDK